MRIVLITTFFMYSIGIKHTTIKWTFKSIIFDLKQATGYTITGISDNNVHKQLYFSQQ